MWLHLTDILDFSQPTLNILNTRTWEQYVEELYQKRGCTVQEARRKAKDKEGYKKWLFRHWEATGKEEEEEEEIDISITHQVLEFELTK